MTITITPYLLYQDVAAALDFLERAFGFEEVLRYTGAEGYVNHAEARLGDTSVYLGDPGEDYRRATVMIGVHGVDDVDALCERASAAGAQIIEQPADQVYGERRFSARDPEGHEWFFSRKTADVAPDQWGATTPATA